MVLRFHLIPLWRSSPRYSGNIYHRTPSWVTQHRKPFKRETGRSRSDQVTIFVAVTVIQSQKYSSVGPISHELGIGLVASGGVRFPKRHARANSPQYAPGEIPYEDRSLPGRHRMDTVFWVRFHIRRSIFPDIFTMITLMMLWR